MLDKIIKKINEYGQSLNVWWKHGTYCVPCYREVSAPIIPTEKSASKKISNKFLGGISGEETSLARYNNNKIVKIIITRCFEDGGVEYLNVIRYNTGYIGDIPPQANIDLENRAGMFTEWLTREEFNKKYKILYTET
jgi:hypothetical protein